MYLTNLCCDVIDPKLYLHADETILYILLFALECDWVTAYINIYIQNIQIYTNIKRLAETIYYALGFKGIQIFENLVYPHIHLKTNLTVEQIHLDIQRLWLQHQYITEKRKGVVVFTT